MRDTTIFSIIWGIIAGIATLGATVKTIQSTYEWLRNSPKLEGKWINSQEGFVNGAPECLKRQTQFIEMNIYSAKNSELDGDMTSDLLRKELAKAMAVAIPRMVSAMADMLPAYKMDIPNGAEALAMAEKAPQTRHTLLKGNLSWFRNSVKRAELFDIVEGEYKTYGYFRLNLDRKGFMWVKSLGNAQNYFPKKFCLYKTEENDVAKT